LRRKTTSRLTGKLVDLGEVGPDLGRGAKGSARDEEKTKNEKASETNSDSDRSEARDERRRMSTA
jgi:hypothetical protein